MTRLVDLTDAMRAYNQSVAPGSECAAWQDYHADCHNVLGYGPRGPGHGRLGRPVPAEFAAYWLAVANGESPYYDRDTGARIDD